MQPMILVKCLCFMQLTNISVWSNVECHQMHQTDTNETVFVSSGKSALHWAAAVNNVEAAIVLLKKGANKDMQNNKVLEQSVSSSTLYNNNNLSEITSLVHLSISVPFLSVSGGNPSILGCQGRKLRDCQGLTGPLREQGNK